MDAFARRFLEAAATEPLTFWQVHGIESGEGLLLKDLAVPRERFVREVKGSQSVKKWDLVFGQVVGLEEEYILHATGPYMLPPGRCRQKIDGFLGETLDAGDTEPIDLLKYDCDLILFYHLCVEELFRPTTPALVNTDGEPLVFATSRYSLDPGNRGKILSKLEAMKGLDSNGEKKSGWVFVWAKEGEEDQDQFTVRGRITVGPKAMVLECNSENRDEGLRRLLEENLQGWIEYENTEVKPFRMEDAPKDQEDDEEGDIADLPEETREAIREMLEKQYLGWIDQKIPALGNRTPKQAVRTAEGREKVIDLVNDWENMQLRNPNPQFMFDFNRIRKALGLEIE
jgi:hypothetical protein